MDDGNVTMALWVLNILVSISIIISIGSTFYLQKQEAKRIRSMNEYLSKNEPKRYW